MFAWLRYFSIFGFIFVLILAVLIGIWVRNMASNDLQNVVENSGKAITQGYINSTWHKHVPNLKRLQQVGDPSLWKRYKEFKSFSSDTFRHLEGAPVTKLNIYTPDGAIILTQNADGRRVTDDVFKIEVDKTEFQKRFDGAKFGSVSSQIIENASFIGPAGNERQGVLVQTLIPIMSPEHSSILSSSDVQADGIIEIFYDVTPQWDQLYQFQLVGTLGIMFIFVFLLIVLYWTSNRAERIISTQHEANVELAATAAKAEAESRQKSQFLANVSHELRTPLNAIIGFSEIIKNQVMGPLQNEQYMNYIQDIHSSGVHLLSLINDILDFSKAEAGKLELHLSELDATKLIKNCMRLVSTRAEEAKVNLATEVPKEHFIITGDAKKLKQVLLNLLSNAVKFTPEDGEVKVLAWQNVMDDSISIEVRDSGIGIAPKDISRAMSPFGQVDSKLSRKYEGTGLGLPLTKKFVELMGGTFKIESELGKGTQITITIPLTPPRHVLKAVAKATPEKDGEKQISPQLMEHAKQSAGGPVDPPGGAPAEPAAPAEDEKPMLIKPAGAEDAPPDGSDDMPEIKPVRITQEHPQAGPKHDVDLTPTSKADLQPVRSLTAGKSLGSNTPPATEPAPEPVELTPPPTLDAQEDEKPALEQPASAPELGDAGEAAEPSGDSNTPSEALPSLASSTPPPAPPTTESAPEPVPVAPPKDTPDLATSEPKAEPQPTPDPVPVEPPPPAADNSSTDDASAAADDTASPQEEDEGSRPVLNDPNSKHTFTSYEDLKKLAQKKK